MSVLPHVLVVEDDRQIGRLVARYLEANDCRVSIAADGRETERALEASRNDLIVLDVMLPGEDGLSLCRRLRMSSQIPIVVLTAKSEDVDRILGLKMGADDPRELLARIGSGAAPRSAGRRGAYRPCGPRVLASWMAARLRDA